MNREGLTRIELATAIACRCVLAVLGVAISPVALWAEAVPASERTPDSSEGKAAIATALLIPQLSMSWDDAPRIVGYEDKFHNDFTLLKDGEGTWHCIGSGGRDGSHDTLFHAVGTSLRTRFEYLPKITSQTNPKAVHMWAPFAIRKDDGTALLYFSHLRGSLEKYMEDHDLWDWGAQFELRLMVSRTPDMRTWVPYASPGLDRQNVIFREPTVRDPCIFWDEMHQRYFMYYSAVIPARGGDGGLVGAIRVRTSKDLIYWSAARTAMTTPPGYTNAESAFVLPRNGLYYLWVCGYDYGRMSLYISETPFYFGDPVENRIREQSGHAPEIVSENGVDHMACVRIGTSELEGSPDELLLGVHIQPMVWSAANGEEVSKVYVDSHKGDITNTPAPNPNGLEVRKSE